MSEQQSNRTNMATIRFIPEEIGEPEGPKVQDIHKLQRSVSLCVCQEDRTILVAVIDRTASRTAIINDLRRELPKFTVPYRNVDQRILRAIRLKLAENITYEEAAICVFGDVNFARKLRYWQNRWQLQ
jgi:hypothetical protein